MRIHAFDEEITKHRWNDSVEYYRKEILDKINTKQRKSMMPQLKTKPKKNRNQLSFITVSLKYFFV